MESLMFRNNFSIYKNSCILVVFFFLFINYESDYTHMNYEEMSAFLLLDSKKVII